jgi:prepilin-type N-terminal cleavage/methylation domain-containing protein
MRQRSAGFTLLEIMVVIIIIGTIMAIAIPKMNDMFETNLKSTIRKLAGAVQFCFNESVIKQTPLRLNFDLVTGEYWLSYLSVNGQTGEFVDTPNEMFDHQKLPSGVFLKDMATPHSQEKRTEGTDFISFFPTGYAEKAVLHLSSRDGRVFTLVVKSMTGRLTVYDREIDFVDLGPQLGGITSEGDMGL